MAPAGYEIERRYLVRVPEALWAELGQGTLLRQGYVRGGEPSVRIRSGEARGPVLTCKSGQGVRRREVEAVVSEEMAAALFQAAGDRVLEKVRFRLGPWDLDRFLGALGGLALLEIELEDDDEALPPPPDGISMLREVTDDNLFTSDHLASMDNEGRAAFVRRIYRESGA